MSGKVDQLRTVEVRLAGDLSAAGDRIAGRAERQAALDVLFALGVLGLSVTLSLLVARTMADPLRRMRTSALEVANDRLPALVERLHRGERVDVESALVPVGQHSRDEIGQVAEAFDTVHRVAVRVAVEQAAIRKSIGDISTWLGAVRP